MEEYVSNAKATSKTFLGMVFNLQCYKRLKNKQVCTAYMKYICNTV